MSEYNPNIPGGRIPTIQPDQVKSGMFHLGAQSQRIILAALRSHLVALQAAYMLTVSYADNTEMSAYVAEVENLIVNLEAKP